jgi:hypothetical protein
VVFSADNFGVPADRGERKPGVVAGYDIVRQRDPLPPIHLSLEQLIEDFSESFTRDD